MQTGGQALWITLGVIALVLARFLFRELRVRRIKTSAIFSVPIVVGVIGAFLVYSVAAAAPDQIPSLAIGGVAAIVVGIGIGLAVAHFTIVRSGGPGVLFVRGSRDAIEKFAGSLSGDDLGLGVLGNPLSDFPGLPILLRALEARMGGYEVMPALQAAERGDIFITVTGSRRVLRREHYERMKDGSLLANAGHFDVELDLEELRSAAGGEARRTRPLIDQYTLPDGRRLNLIAGGRVVNLAAAEGHPAAVMDVSFALQALCVEDLVRRGADLEPAVHAVPEAIDREVARLKLDALGVEIDAPTPEQASYRESWA